VKSPTHLTKTKSNLIQTVRRGKPLDEGGSVHVSLSRTSCWLICWHVNWRIIKSHVENILQNFQLLLNKNNPYYWAFTQLLRSCKGTITFMKQYKTWKLNQNLAHIIFLYSKSQRHIYCHKINVNTHHHRHQEINFLCVSLIPRTIQTKHFPCTATKHPRFPIFDDFFRFSSTFASFRAFLQVFERDFTVPQINRDRAYG
jgi:hypothetical protein